MSAKKAMPEVTEIVDFFKQRLELDIVDGGRVKNRQFAYLLFKKYGSVDAVKRVIDILASDGFHYRNCTRLSYVYYHGEQAKRGQDQVLNIS